MKTSHNFHIVVQGHFKEWSLTEKETNETSLKLMKQMKLISQNCFREVQFARIDKE